MWSAVITYGLPLSCLLIIHIRITIFLRRQSNTERLLIKRQQSRNFVAIRCIFMTVALLLTGGLPGVVFTVIFFITGEEPLLMHRGSVFSLTISMTGLSIGLVFFTPELKRIILGRRQENQVVHNEQIVVNQQPRT